MDALNVLEQKVSTLVEMLYGLKQENNRLIEINKQLEAKLAAQEIVMQMDCEQYEQLNQEKAYTKTAIGNLIQRIDSLVEGENQP